jgi:hypothetical protein
MNVMINDITEDLDTTVQGVQAAITLFLLIMAILMIPCSKLSDRWGRKRCFTIGLVLYGIGALLSAVSPGLGVLILGNSVLEGVGTALLIPPVYILTTLLGLMRDQPGRLQVIKPALHALAMRAHKPRTLSAASRCGAPAHHRRQPHDELLDRAREPCRARSVPEPEQVALDRVDARLQPIIARREAATGASRAPQQRAHNQTTRLRRQRLARRPIPAPTRNSATRRTGVLQRHRQRPSARTAHDGQRPRPGARGAAGRTRRDHPRAS